MAGWVERGKDSKYKQEGFISNRLRKLSRMGMKFDDSPVKNSRAIGIAEKRDMYNKDQTSDADMYSAFASMTMADSSMKDSIAFFDKSYFAKRDELKKFALNDEIDNILDVLTDECVIYDDYNFACQAYYNGEIKDNIKQEVNTVFRNVYNYFNFTDGHSIWDYFKTWLVEGYLAFEIVYNKAQTQIIGFKELDVLTLKPDLEKDEEGNFRKIFIQNPGKQGLERRLVDSQVIYLSYSQNRSVTRTSYVERLVRSFNLMRIMETTRISWAVTNASFKMKFTIPVGGLSRTRAQESLSMLMNSYKENINFNYDSGELTVNGEPFRQFNREYWMPSKEGETPELEVLGGEGPEMSDTEAIKYFVNKLQDASKIPYNRFDPSNPTGYELAAEGMMRDEIRFSQFVKRLHAKFKMLLLKPLYIQMMLNHPELNDDQNFRMNLTITFNRNNVFDELKEYELMQKRIDILVSLKDSLSTQDANMADVPVFDMYYLIDKIMIQKYFKMTPDDMRDNDDYKEISSIQKEGYSRSDAVQIHGGKSRKRFKKVVSASSASDTGSETDMSGDDTGGDMPPASADDLDSSETDTSSKPPKV